jgi:hypothetical protein
MIRIRRMLRILRLLRNQRGIELIAAVYIFGIDVLRGLAVWLLGVLVPSYLPLFSFLFFIFPPIRILLR